MKGNYSMIDKSTAYVLAKKFLETAEYRMGNEDSYMIVEQATIEKDYGWIFFYTSRKYIETGDEHYALYGNGPIVVEKSDGSTHQLGSAGGSKKQIEMYEARRKKN